MTSHLLAIVGLGLDIIGTFFLAVEAIKIKNLKALRDRLIRRYSVLLPRPIAGSNLSDDRRWLLKQLKRHHPTGPHRESSHETSSDTDTSTQVVGESDGDKKDVVKLEAGISRLKIIYLSIPAHIIAGTFLLVVSNVVVGGQLFDWVLLAAHWLSTLSIWLKVPLAVFVSGLMLFILFMIGELVHVVILRSFQKLVSFVAWIERRTASGFVGIVGFTFLFTGFTLQIFANYLQL